jgi:hypothetical protein
VNAGANKVLDLRIPHLLGVVKFLYAVDSMESFIMLVGEPVASRSDVSRSYGNCGPFSG